MMRSSSYRNQSTDLLCKSADCFYTIGTSVMKELRRSSPILLRKSALKCRRTELAFFIYLRFLSQTSTIHKTAGEGGSYLFMSFLPLPPASETLRHYPGYCCRQLTSVHSWQAGSNQESMVS